MLDAISNMIMNLWNYFARGKTALITTALLLVALFVWYYPGEAPSGDAAYKYLQVKDFVSGGFSTFACDWPGKKYDPTFEWFPFQEPMAYVIDGECFYVFPYQLIFAYLPFYLLAGNVGIYLVSLLAGWGILLLTYLAGGRLGMNERARSGLVWFSFAAYGLTTYALGMNEFTLTGVLVLGAVFIALGRSTLAAVLGGLCIGIALQFRVESALLGCTIPAAIWLFATDERRRLRAVVFFATFAVILGLFFAANQAVFGHPLGLRGIVFLEGQQQTILDRLLRLARYWVGRPTALFINTPVFIFIIPVLWMVFRGSSYSRSSYNTDGAESNDMDDQAINDERFVPGIKMLALIAVSYAVVVPVLVANYPGAQFGERFLFNVYPLFAIIAFQVFTLAIFPDKLRGWIMGILLVGTLLYTAAYLGIAYQVDRAFHSTSKLMGAGTQDSEVVVFRNYVMVNAAFAHFHDRPQYLAVEDEKFLKLVASLRAAGVRKIAVAHSSPFYRKQLGMHAELVPDDFEYEYQSDDLGNELIELRRYEF